jgi:hypothetical protein
MELRLDRNTFLKIRDCSICGSPIGYRMDPELAALMLDTRCGCSAYERDLGPENVATWAELDEYAEAASRAIRAALTPQEKKE